MVGFFFGRTAHRQKKTPPPNNPPACDQLAAELAKQLKQAELLKQAVLKAAFSGGLLDK